MAGKRDGSCADRRIGRDVCTHCRRLQKKQNRAKSAPCHPASEAGFPVCAAGYGFSPLAVSREASALSEDALASLRPRACDFRRLRFSRNASFSRSRRESFTSASFFSRALVLIALHRQSVEYALIEPGTTPPAAPPSEHSGFRRRLAAMTRTAAARPREAMIRRASDAGHGWSGTGSVLEFPAVDRVEAACRATSAAFLTILGPFRPARVLAPEGPLWQEPAA